MRILMEMMSQLRDASCKADLRTVAGRAFRNLGFIHWGYLAYGLGDAEAMPAWGIREVPSPLENWYVSNDYLKRDPAIRYAKEYGIPLIWPYCPADSSAQIQRLTEKMGEEARSLGVGTALLVSIRGINHRRGLAWCCAPPDKDRDFIEEAFPDAFLLVHCLHETADRFVDNENASVRPVLSSREQECLKWAALGKTNWEIATLTGISERTVIYHIANAGSKLGTGNKPATVARAALLRLIDLDRRPRLMMNDFEAKT